MPYPMPDQGTEYIHCNLVLVEELLCSKKGGQGIKIQFRKALLTSKIEFAATLKSKDQYSWVS